MSKYVPLGSRVVEGENGCRPYSTKNRKSSIWKKNWETKYLPKYDFCYTK